MLAHAAGQPVAAQWLGLMRIDYEARDVLGHDAGLIIAANHPSMLDIRNDPPRGMIRSCVVPRARALGEQHQ